MRIITCASYFATGSSAVIDFFSEFENVQEFGNYEYRFIQDPDGIADLEYNIIENNHRHNTSNAIKRFRRFMNGLKGFGYGDGYKIFGDKLDFLVDKYISEITELQVHTWWHRDRIDKGAFFCFMDRGYSFVKRLFTGGLHTEKRYSLLRNREWGYYSAISEETFLTATKRFVDDLFSSVNPNMADFMLIEQLVPPTNVDRYVRYFNDVKVIVVDRDPRDVYLSEKDRYCWGVIPVGSVEDYVEWFKITRRYSRPANEDHSKILRIKFEDMIYKYDETMNELMQFVGVDKSKHINKMTKFNPSRSIRNTNLKNQIKGYEEDIKYIEENLREYLYDFDSVIV